MIGITNNQLNLLTKHPNQQQWNKLVFKSAHKTSTKKDDVLSNKTSIKNLRRLNLRR